MKVRFSVLSMIISLGDVDRDKFELHLRNLLNQHLGVGFVTGKVQIKFHHVADKELCEIETSPRKRARHRETEGQERPGVEKFYARSGNSSQEIPLGEMSTYIKERFHS